MGVAKAKVDLDVATVDPAQFLQALYQLPDQGLPFWIALREHTQKSDARHRAGLLGARRERPRSRRAAERDELAPSHSITSSARASSEIGTIRPSALAVFRLMNNSTLVVCWTGRSAGFSPLRI